MSLKSHAAVAEINASIVLLIKIVNLLYYVSFQKLLFSFYSVVTPSNSASLASASSFVARTIPSL